MNQLTAQLQQLDTVVSQVRRTEIHCTELGGLIHRGVQNSVTIQTVPLCHLIGRIIHIDAQVLCHHDEGLLFIIHVHHLLHERICRWTCQGNLAVE